MPSRNDPIGPVGRQALRAALAVPTRTLTRCRGGYGDGRGNVFTVRTVRQLQRDALVDFVGAYGDAAQLTPTGVVVAEGRA